eukprot:1376437-Pyramimonas_sp.AAC.1
MPDRDVELLPAEEELREERRAAKLGLRREMEAAQLEALIERTARRAAEKTGQTALEQVKEVAATVARDT